MRNQKTVFTRSKSSTLLITTLTLTLDSITSENQP